jgi:GntR family transcriptional regulator
LASLRAKTNGAMVRDRGAAKIEPDYDDWLALYLRLARVFRHRIRMGMWKPGSQLPPIPELCKEFGASRTPVRQALALLVQDGIIKTAQGRGTFVADDFASSLDDESLRISISDPLVMGAGQKFRVLKREIINTLPEELATEQPQYPEYVRTQKTHSHKSTRFATMNIFVARHLYDQFPPKADAAHKTVHLLRAHTDFKPVRYRQEITIVHASNETARLLDITLASVVVQARRWWAEECGTLACASLAFYRSDMYVLDLTLNDPGGKAFGLQAMAPGRT